jgi:hypothetical protein
MVTTAVTCCTGWRTVIGAGRGSWGGTNRGACTRVVIWKGPWLSSFLLAQSNVEAPLDVAIKRAATLTELVMALGNVGWQRLVMLAWGHSREGGEVGVPCDVVCST